MNDTQEVTFDEDLAWCFDAVSDVSRTFAITIDVLDEPMASRICVGYLLCRVADTVEDAGHIPPAIQQELLEEYQEAIARDGDVTVQEFDDDVAEWIPDEPGEDADDWEVVENAPRIVRTFEHLPEADREAIRDPVCELVGGMATFVDRHAETGGLRIETPDELEEYCWYAAGTVGELITNLVTRGTDPQRTEVLQEHARSFALLLQLVNVAKDVTDDYHEENNVYLPASWLREYGVEQDAVCEKQNRREVTSVIERVTDRAAGYLDDALIYLEALPEHRGNTLAAWAIPYLLAVGTIRELRERPEDVLEEGGVKVPKPEVLTLIAQFDGGVDKAALAELRQQMERRPLHQH
ncbi:phytoene/squalene synthase family protein [Natranaeroarchaeum sulfidigenes]|uniref:Phytoene/squalene synthetase n=1 Tax=Natranaeroarchaeum sulfidigenes TaxID=2784880 RepID=A0A897MSU1_9EURY|nr:phytoene/squalene synthase family protein [Natranaeroarchaeum sulfidigenes]QSG02029.1 Phytoene/squalene synthetase [Natranaeroarchaeum sulfidigenes]